MDRPTCEARAAGVIQNRLPLKNRPLELVPSTSEREATPESARVAFRFVCVCMCLCGPWLELTALYAHSER